MGTTRAAADTDYDNAAMNKVRQLAAMTRESDFQIKAQTWKVAQLLREKGIMESKESILAGMLDAYLRTDSTSLSIESPQEPPVHR
jgi:hypothetical protein